MSRAIATSVDEVNAIMKSASESGPLAGLLGYNTAPLVSIDFNHDPASSTFDATLTNVVAFLPLLLVKGKTGDFIYSLPIVVSWSLVAAMLVAWTIAPLLGFYMLKGQKSLGAAQTAAGRAAALTHRLLAFSRRQTLSPTPVIINRLMAEINRLREDL